MREHNYYVYIITNKGNTVLYTGLTNNLTRRMYEHKNKLISGFSKKYNVNKLVYYCHTTSIESAILEEKKIKAGNRKKKIERVEKMNPEWKDLSDDLFEFE